MRTHRVHTLYTSCTPVVHPVFTPLHTIYPYTTWTVALHTMRTAYPRPGVFLLSTLHVHAWFTPCLALCITSYIGVFKGFTWGDSPHDYTTCTLFSTLFCTVLIPVFHVLRSGV